MCDYELMMYNQEDTGYLDFPLISQVTQKTFIWQGPGSLDYIKYKKTASFIFSI